MAFAMLGTPAERSDGAATRAAVDRPAAFWRATRLAMREARETARTAER